MASDGFDRAALHVDSACRHCGEVLDVVLGLTLIQSDEVHSCYGDRFGYIGRVESDRVIVEDDRVRLESPEVALDG